MANVRRFIDQAAAGDFPVLLLGESGTGKELIARLIHAQSRRSNRPFVPLNCAGVSDELLGNELFGHAPGAFTGAASAQGGLFEAAEGGVLLLDEIGDMSPANQSSMLRVIESGGYRRLGESEERFADVRIMAATHQDLEVQIHKGAFRSDLFHRLNVFTLTIAPLREHKEDIPPLVQHTLSQIDPAENKKHVTDDAMKVLQAYDWPGNVRELKNCMLRASAFSGSEGIDANALDFLMNTKTFHQGTQDAGLQSLADVERDLLKDALEQTNWNKKAAAERLGISRNQLYTRIARYGLKDPGKD
jgi:DNA-binding NtrC family response regulator